MSIYKYTCDHFQDARSFLCDPLGVIYSFFVIPKPSSSPHYFFSIIYLEPFHFSPSLLFSPQSSITRTTPVICLPASTFANSWERIFFFFPEKWIVVDPWAKQHSEKSNFFLGYPWRRIQLTQVSLSSGWLMSFKPIAHLIPLFIALTGGRILETPHWCVLEFL